MRHEDYAARARGYARSLPCHAAILFASIACLNRYAYSQVPIDSSTALQPVILPYLDENSTLITSHPVCGKYTAKIIVFGATDLRPSCA